MTDSFAKPPRGWPAVIAPALALLLLAALRPLAVPDEGRYADISRWMLVSGDWLTPRLDGLPFFHKPPLTHWLQAASMAVLGVTPWAARVPGVLLATLMLAGVSLAGRRLADAALARRATWMLGASGGFLIGGQYVNHDIGVAAWIASAIWCFVFALWDGERPHAGWARAGFAACALGLLTKGLIGVALPGLVIGAWVLATRQWRKLLHLPWLSGLALFALIALPWFWRAGERYPGLWSYLFGVQQFTRYTGSGFNNEQPWWFYGAACALLMFPWAFFAAGDGVARLRALGTRQPPADSPHRRLAVLCWIWLAAIVLFFSLPRSKLIGYILPVLPPLALLAALGWQRALGQRRWADRAFVALVLGAATLPAVLTVMAPRIEAGKLSDDVALALAFSFAGYGFLKKRVTITPAQSLSAETAILAPAAAVAMVVLAQGNGIEFGSDPKLSLLLATSGLVTAVPLVFFAASARRIPLTMLGLLQYLTPTLQFLCGVFVFQEPMSSSRWVGFALVWVALMCMSFDAVRSLRSGEQVHDSDEAVVAAAADLG